MASNRCLRNSRSVSSSNSIISRARTPFSVYKLWARGLFWVIFANSFNPSILKEGGPQNNSLSSTSWPPTIKKSFDKSKSSVSVNKSSMTFFVSFKSGSDDDKWDDNVWTSLVSCLLKSTVDALSALSNHSASYFLKSAT